MLLGEANRLSSVQTSSRQTMTANIPSLAKQNLLLEFASLKHASPEGLYVTITPGDPSLWSGVLFVREGPYKGAALRFQISFPYPFPAFAPLITFSSEIFHPLLTPLTTYTYTTSTSDTDTVSATDLERLPPGGFSLRHGFPQWFGRERKASLESAKSPKSDGSSTFATSTTSRPVDVTMFDVLEYMRRAFSSEELLGSITLGAAANPGAYHAYRTFKGRDLPTSPVESRTTSPEPSTSRARRPGEWNWDGVWEERVKRGVQSTLTEPMLFGGAGAGDDVIRFSDLQDDAVQKIKAQMLHQ